MAIFNSKLLFYQRVYHMPSPNSAPTWTSSHRFPTRSSDRHSGCHKPRAWSCVEVVPRSCRAPATSTTSPRSWNLRNTTARCACVQTWQAGKARGRHVMEVQLARNIKDPLGDSDQLSRHISTGPKTWGDVKLLHPHFGGLQTIQPFLWRFPKSWVPKIIQSWMTMTTRIG